MSWRCGDLAEWCGGRLQGDPETVVDRFSTDTRKLRSGDLFVAIKGERFDGHDFVPAALEGGASALLLARNGIATGGVPAIRVDDTVVALGEAAREHRACFAGPVIAITGSNGKTTTKELCAEMLGAGGRRVCRNPGSFNNEIGLPLSILALSLDDEVLVVEMGMNHLGEIDRLARIASPDVGAITQVARAHLGPVGSLDAIARAKGELFDHIRSDGTAIVNADDPNVMAQRSRFGGACLRFSASGAAEAELRAERVRPDGAGTAFTLVTPWGAIDVRLDVPGAHLVNNALCAAGAALASGALPADPLPSLCEGLARFEGVAGRLTLRRTTDGWTLLDDSFNSNPSSATVALRTLRDLAREGRAIAVLADMLELGDEAEALHAEVGRCAAELGVDALIAVGELSAFTASAAREAGLSDVREAASAEAAAASLSPKRGDVVLIKGSHGMHMERAVQALLGAQA